MVLYSNASVVGYPYNYCVNSLAKRALTYQCQTSNLYCAINSYNSTNKQYITYYNILFTNNTFIIPISFFSIIFSQKNTK